jgi:hypothetical protein
VETKRQKTKVKRQKNEVEELSLSYTEKHRDTQSEEYRVKGNKFYLRNSVKPLCNSVLVLKEIK